MTSLKDRILYWTVAIALVILVNKVLDLVDWLKRKRKIHGTWSIWLLLLFGR